MTPVRKPGLMSRLFSRFGSPDSPGVWFFGPNQSGRLRDNAYAGASWVRKQLANWLPLRASADADLLPDQNMLVARSRDLDRNNGVASGAFQTSLDNVVGVGMRLSAWPDWRALGKDAQWAENWSRQVESLWRTWADCPHCDVAGKMNFHSLTQLVYRSVLQNGEALALPLWMERPNTPWRTCLQLVEVDRLSNPQWRPPTLVLRGGIQMDCYGKPTAYYIAKIDTWTGLFFPAMMTGRWECIPAETDWGRKRVIHVYSQDRVDQSRGKPVLAPVIEQFRMLDAYQRSELQSAIVNALVAGVIETPLDPASLAELMGGDPNAYLAAKNQYRVELEAGTVVPLYPGDKMVPFAPARPATQYAAFCEYVFRQIGVAMGMPYELIMKDFSKTTYSSARASLLESFRHFTTVRTWLTSYWAQPVYNLWLEEAVAAGLVEAPNFYEQMHYYVRAKWIGPGRGWIDPVREAEAAQLRLATGISTLEAECAEQGMDYNDVIDQRAIEKQQLQDAGLWIEPPPPKPTGFPAEPVVTPVRERA